MFINEIIKGRYVSLRSAELSDAEVTLKIRLDPNKTKFLHKTENNLEKQKIWLKNQRERNGDYFFVVESLDGKFIGTTSIYDMNDEHVAHAGRLLMIGNPIQSFEAFILMLQYGFEHLGVEKFYGDVDTDNTASYNFSAGCGFVFSDNYVEEDGRKYRLCYCDKESFAQAKEKIEKLIYR